MQLQGRTYKLHADIVPVVRCHSVSSEQNFNQREKNIPKRRLFLAWSTPGLMIKMLLFNPYQQKPYKNVTNRKRDAAFRELSALITR